MSHHGETFTVPPLGDDDVRRDDMSRNRAPVTKRPMANFAGLERSKPRSRARSRSTRTPARR